MRTFILFLIPAMSFAAANTCELTNPLQTPTVDQNGTTWQRPKAPPMVVTAAAERCAKLGAGWKLPTAADADYSGLRIPTVFWTSDTEKDGEFLAYVYGRGVDHNGYQYYSWSRISTRYPYPMPKYVVVCVKYSE